MRLDITLRMLCFDSQALNTLLALLGVLHLVSAVPSGFRPQKTQDTSTELYARYVIGEYGTNRTGFVEPCGPGSGLGVPCGGSIVSTSANAISTLSSNTLYPNSTTVRTSNNVKQAILALMILEPQENESLTLVVVTIKKLKLFWR